MKYLIYQETPDISEGVAVHSIIPPAYSSLKFQYFQHHRNSCPVNNSPGTHSAIQYTSKHQRIFPFMQQAHEKEYVHLSKGGRNAKYACGSYASYVYVEPVRLPYRNVGRF
jgi:hypothetical protein